MPLLRTWWTLVSRFSQPLITTIQKTSRLGLLIFFSFQNSTYLEKIKKIRWFVWHKIKIKDMWESIRFKQDNVAWFQEVWPSLRVERYAIQNWVLCHDKQPTLARLSHFGIPTHIQCFLYVEGLKTILYHLFLKCTYLSFISQIHITGIHVQLPETSTWPKLFTSFES